MFKGILKEDTAVVVNIGILLAYNSDITPVTTATLSAADDAVIRKNGGASIDISGNTFTAAANADGHYSLSLTASNTDTPGILDVILRDDSVFKPVSFSFQVVPANVYDSLFGGTDNLEVDVLLWDGGAASALLTDADSIRADVISIDGVEGYAAKLGAGAAGISAFSVITGSTTSLVKSNATESTNDHYNGRSIVFTSGALSGQATSILDYDGTTKAFTVSTLTEAPTSGDTFTIA
jgi:hypothetical protein